MTRIERGKLFQSLPPIIDNIFWPKVVRLNGVIQSPSTETRVVYYLHLQVFERRQAAEAGQDYLTLYIPDKPT